MTVPTKHPAIFQRAAEFTYAFPQVDPVELAQSLVHTMMENNGVGLAAPQLGIPLRVFAIYSDPYIVCFNPRIVDRSIALVEYEEGCLSYPGLTLKIQRPAWIRARYAEPNGDIVTNKFEGIKARVFQHEMLHLDGVRWTDGVSKLKLELARKKLAKQRK